MTKRKITEVEDVEVHDSSLRRGASALRHAGGNRQDQYYEVDHILGMRLKQNPDRREFQVLWKGYVQKKGSNPTWEPEENLGENFDPEINQFVQRLAENYGCSPDPYTCERYPDIKAEINALVADCAKQNRYDASDACLVLDGASLRTSKALKEVGFPKECIDVPNSGGTYYGICRNAYSTVTQETVHSFLSRIDKKYVLIWLDYCCTFNGSANQETTPRQDIKLAFSKLRGFRASLGVTFSHRCLPSKEASDEMMQYLRECANENGYHITKTHERDYGLMQFRMLDLIRGPLHFYGGAHGPSCTHTFKIRNFSSFKRVESAEFQFMNRRWTCFANVQCNILHVGVRCIGVRDWESAPFCVKFTTEVVNFKDSKRSIINSECGEMIGSYQSRSAAGVINIMDDWFLRDDVLTVKFSMEIVDAYFGHIFNFRD